MVCVLVVCTGGVYYEYSWCVWQVFCVGVWCVSCCFVCVMLFCVYTPTHTSPPHITRSHVEHEFAKLRSCNSVHVAVHNIGEWWEADTDSNFATAVQGVIEEVWGVKPLLVREGGTMPVASLLERLLGSPAMLIPMGQSSDNYHLANERIRRSNLVKGKNVVKRLLTELPAALGRGEK